MKKLITLLLVVIGLQAAAQTATIEANYGSDAMSRPVKLHGGYEGLAISYRWERPKGYFEVQVWNTDLTRLHSGKDSSSYNSFGAEYGIGAGWGFQVFRVGEVSLNIITQVGLTYNNGGTTDSHYGAVFQDRVLKPVIRGMVQLNCGIGFLTFGSEYETSSFINNRPYINRFWFGIGVRQ